MLPLGFTVENIRVTEELHGAMSNAIYLARATDTSDREYLVTCGSRQTRPLDQIRAELTYSLGDLPRQPLIMTVNGELGPSDILIERTPPGRPLINIEQPLSLKTTARLLLELSDFIAKAHERNVVLYGVRPDLVWANGWATTPELHELSITGLTPRAMKFLLGLKPARGGLCFADVYAPREVWRNEPCGPAVDIFGLCALGYFLSTKRAPFPGEHDYNQALRQVLSGELPDWAPGPLGPILSRGLAADPTERPSLAALQSALSAI